MKKIITVLGTRPEIIRLSVIIQKLDSNYDHKLVHTGQNMDSNMRDIFFSELNIREPDLSLNMNGQNLGVSLGQLFSELGGYFEAEKPDGVLILGDTNSGLVSILAKRMHIPVFHLEAGNRSFDLNVPEEINRKIIDHSSDFNLVYTEFARRNLLDEGFHPRHVFLIGSPMREVFNTHMQEIMDSNVLQVINTKPQEYILLSLHRQENVNTQERFQKILNNVSSAAKHFGKKVIFSAHPRTLDLLEKWGIKLDSIFQIMPALGFVDYNSLQKNSFVVLSDSGSISEESGILNFDALTIRQSMERPEAIESGLISLSSIDSSEIINNINFLKIHQNKEIPNEYLIENTSSRVINIIYSTLELYDEWFGIRY